MVQSANLGREFTVWQSYHSVGEVPQWEIHRGKNTWSHCEKQCEHTVFHRVNTLSDRVKLEHFHSVVALQSRWYTVWQHGDTQCGNMVIHIVAKWWEHSVRSVATVWIWPIITVLIPLKQYFHSVDKQYNTLCSRCGHTVTHSVDTQCSTLCSKVWWHCDSQTVYTIPQCENGPNPHSRNSPLFPFMLSNTAEPGHLHRVQVYYVIMNVRAGTVNSSNNSFI